MYTLKLIFGAGNVTAWQLADMVEKLNRKFDFENNVDQFSIDMEQREVVSLSGKVRTENVGVIKLMMSEVSTYCKVLAHRLIEEAADIIRAENKALNTYH